MNFFEELKRRHVYRVGVLYLVVALGLIEGTDAVQDTLDLPVIVARFVTISALAGFPLALLLSWVYDLTSEGVVVTEPASGVGMPPILMASTLVAFALVFGCTGWWVTQSGASEVRVPMPMVGAPRGLPRSLVVLPFDDLSPSQDQEYFAHGMSDELIAELGKSDGLEVRGRMTGAAIKRSNMSLFEIAEETGATGLIDGSVRKAGDQLRISVQIVALSDGSTVWADTFNRPLSEVFELQSDVASAVTSALRRSSSDEPRLPTESVAAYQHYVAGKGLYYSLGSAERLEAAVLRLKDATEVDREFADAYGLIGMIRSLQCQLGFLPCSEALLHANEAAQRALKFDPTSYLGWNAHGLVLVRQYRWKEAEAAFRRGTELAPSDGTNWMSLGQVLTYTGRIDEGVEAYERALALDPMNPLILITVANGFRAVGDPDRAIQLVSLASRALGRPSRWVSLISLQAHAAAGRLEDSAEALAAFGISEIAMEPVREAARQGELASFQRAVLDVLVAASGRRCTHTRQFGAALRRDAGDDEGALDCLFEMAENRDFITSDSLFVQSFAHLRGDPRFQRVLREMNLVN